MATEVATLAHQPPVQYDPIFFPKEAIKRGTRLTNYGRRDPLSVWLVIDIHTFVRLTHNEYSLAKTDYVVHLSDMVTLKRMGKNDGSVSTRRETSFSGLSYSAIWRLA